MGQSLDKKRIFRQKRIKNFPKIKKIKKNRDKFRRRN